ncbi:MAG: 1,4-alpha-glucan branching protein GlgB [Lachnospiraceae bacterium]|nr:1,4-alpha-glucan branching protein GlgB [Lachnospiraceae bacterium]
MNKKLYKMMNWAEIEGIVYSESDNPHALLGAHVNGSSVLVQTFQPGAKSVRLQLLDGDSSYKMEMADEEGYFALLLPGRTIPAYEYIVEAEDGSLKKCRDAYNFAPQITRQDTEKFNAGIHYMIYEKLGAHPMKIDGVEGVNFAVWAPNALRVSVVGDFNGWDGRVHQMRRLWDSGIFELFIPDVKAGDCYKFEIKVKGGLTFMKADPYAFGAQLRPDSASIVRDIDGFEWEDNKWMKNRAAVQADNEPINIYEMYLGSFAKPEDGRTYYNYRELAPKIIEYVKRMGYTHIELMPVMEHPLDASWGYQVIGYYAPTSRYGTAEDFMFFMNEMHKAGIGVILDWVPAHFPRDTYGLSAFDGTCLYEHQDPRQGSHPHWGTLIYNYGRPEVTNYLIANALYWVEQYHADGIRIDAVASMLYLDYGKRDGEWVANIYGGNENLEAVEFLKHLNSIMKKRNAGVLMIAEESTAWPKITGALEDDGLGFDLKWNMGFMNDYLGYIQTDPYFRSGRHNELTFSMIYAYSEKFMLVFSHDEVVHGKATLLGKMPGARQEQFANLRLTYAYHMTHPGKKLFFMGQDIGEYDEFNENRSVEWELLENADHKGLNQLVADMNRLYTSRPALYAKDTSWDGFEWINCITPDRCMLSYVRKTDKETDTLVVVANFANVKQDFRVGVPFEGKYQEIFNSDAVSYGGKGIVNEKICNAIETEWDGKPYAIDMVSAPLSLSIFSYTPYTKEEKEEIERKRAEELRMAREAEERRLAQEEADRTAQLAAEAREMAKQAVKEAKELAKRAAMEAEERTKTAEALEKKAQEAARNLQRITQAQEEAAQRREADLAAAVSRSAGKKAKSDKPAGKENDGKQTAGAKAAGKKAESGKSAGNRKTARKASDADKSGEIKK